MILTKLVRAFADLVRVNVHYATAGSQRNRFREVLKVDGLDVRQRRQVAAELHSAAEIARPFAGLADTSLTLSSIRLSTASKPSVNLVIGEVSEHKVFAGIRTALAVAAGLSRKLKRPLRVVMLDFTSPDNNLMNTAAFIRRSFGVDEVTVIPRERLQGALFGQEDVWLATHSKTAHAIQIACNSNVIDSRRVAYLIQDYEPGFSSWSTEFAVASATYHAGFVPIVNSIPLWRYLCDAEGLSIDRSLVFAPRFESERLLQVASQRKPQAPLRVLFYGRPSKQRNLFRLGLSALRAAALQLGSDAQDVEFFSAGEAHETVDLGSGARMIPLGKLSWDDYFDFLGTTDVALSLQFSPHPSHPPFDAAISGAIAVTNEFHGTRAELHPRIMAVAADPTQLADAIVAAIRQTQRAREANAQPAAYLEVADGLLGNTLDRTLDSAIKRLQLG